MLRKPKRRPTPSNWASWRPFGIGEQRPNNFGEVFRAVGENRDRAGYAWRILSQGVCDGCALGTTGLRDWTIDGVHICNIRLRLLRLNTMPALDPAPLGDAASLGELRGEELRGLGRIPFPMRRRRGEPGFSRIGWEEALDSIAARIRDSEPDRLGFYLTSRGTTNETYYAAQKAVRALGTNSVDNAARVCHSPSTFGLKEAIGVGATTCSYTDWIGTDLIVFIGSNVANNQPVAAKYLHLAKKAGTKVVSVNPYREPGMERYWIPSTPESAVFGTRITDRWFGLNVGGDVGFLSGVLKAMIELGLTDERFIAERTEGFAELAEEMRATEWELCERIAGSSRAEMTELARMLGEAKRGVLVWSMGVTQHERGEDNVRAIVNLGLARGFVGREGCGLMPIRGHSGVQGGAEMGCYSTSFPGGDPVNAENARALGERWGFEVSAQPGKTAPEMLDAARRGALDLLFASGGDFTRVMPEPRQVREALERIPLRVHMDIVLAHQMFAEPGEEVIVLPATTRYEVPGGVTETSTERRVIYSPEIRGPRVEEARPEWEVLAEVARRARPELAERLEFDGTAAIREEIAEVIPQYRGIELLSRQGDSFQFGGPNLPPGEDFDTEDGKAHFSTVPMPEPLAEDGRLALSTRRGKQFNSMVQESRDSITGAMREAVLLSAEDAERLGIADGDEVLVASEVGELRGVALVAQLAPGNVQVHWPEGNALIADTRRSPQAGIPDYNARVTVRPVPPSEAASAPAPGPPGS
jgi:molybdopterin-dependent oxidoreductase alpha subunit